MNPGHLLGAAWPSARRTADLLRHGSLSADDLARAVRSRIDAAEPGLQAFASLLPPDVAAAQARRLSGPLAGLPVAVKDIFDSVDLPTGHGTTARVPAPAATDAAIVALLRRAGGLMIGKSATTEYAFLHPAATRNPRAPGHTPGGSSSGSAAAVAAGLVPLAIGTQTGGSVIRPASYCGVVGYKPTFGWLPTGGLKTFSWSMDTVGLFANDVSDMAWFAQALTGRTYGLPPRQGPWTVAVPTGYPWGDPSPGMAAAVQAGSRALAGAGAQVQPVSLPDWAAEAFDAHAVIQGFEAWRCLAREWDEHPDALSPLMRDYLSDVRDIDAVQYERAQHQAAAARARAATWLAQFDLVLTPSAPDEPPAGLDSTGPSTFNRIWTLLGVPCVSVPGLVGPGGCPVGLQLVASRGADARLLQGAERLAQALRHTAGGRHDEP